MSQSPAMADWCSSYHGLSPMTSMPLSQPWLMCPTAWMCEEEAAGVRRIINNRGNTALSPDNHRCIPCHPATIEIGATPRAASESLTSTERR